MTLEAKLLKRKNLGNLRHLCSESNLIDFVSNDYLGLARSIELTSAVEQEIEKNLSLLHGFGSTGSRLLTGNVLYAENLEQNIASFHDYSAGLIFNCGYMANLGVISAIAGKETTFLFDAHVHASMRDGIVLSRAQSFPFRHNDLTHLENRLKLSSSKDLFICIESLYSTDGSKAPLVEICHLAEKYNARLIIDEAHAVGVCGPQGKGLIAEQNLQSSVFAQVVTFGKALGVQGAIVLGSPLLKQILINFATSVIYTTALPFYSLAAIACSYALFPQMQKEREHLNQLSSVLGKTHIHSVLIPGNKAVKEAARKLQGKGFDIRPLTSPTVQRGQEVLRICLHAFNSLEELTQLIGILKCN